MDLTIYHTLMTGDISMFGPRNKQPWQRTIKVLPLDQCLAVSSPRGWGCFPFYLPCQDGRGSLPHVGGGVSNVIGTHVRERSYLDGII